MGTDNEVELIIKLLKDKKRPSDTSRPQCSGRVDVHLFKKSSAIYLQLLGR